MALSEKARMVEEDNAKKAEAEQAQVSDKQLRVYWHQSSEGQLANLELEEYSGGRLARFERPLRANEHVVTTDDPDVVAFIEAHDSFRNGTIQFCGFGEKGRQVAAQKTAELNARKEIRVHSSEIVSTSPTVTDMKELPAEVDQAPVAKG